MHVHRESVVLPDGTVVVAVSFDGSAPYDREEPPAFGVYLDPRWQPPWPHELLDWPDFGVPNDLDAFRRQLANVLSRARQGETVEVGCLGGHGRTGTLLACLAIAAGVDPAEAVGWVRHNYCESAVETPLQRDFVSSFINE